MISIKQFKRLFVSDNLSWELLKLSRKITNIFSHSHSAISETPGLQSVEIINQIGERKYQELLNKLFDNSIDSCLSDVFVKTALQYVNDEYNNTVLLTSSNFQETINKSEYSSNLNVININMGTEVLHSGELSKNLTNAINQAGLVDCLIIPEPWLASLLLLQNDLLSGISKLCRGELLMVLQVSHKQTILDNVFEKPLDSGNLNLGFVFKDGFVRKHGHLGGFFEIERLHDWLDGKLTTKHRQAVSRYHIQRGLYYLERNMTNYHYQAPSLSALYSFRKIPNRKWISLP